MENRDRTRDEGGQGQRNKPGQGGGQQPDGREGQGGSQKPGRPTPSGVPNEGRYEYKGGRQGSGGVPNPDDEDDQESAGSFRGTAEKDIGSDDDNRSLGAGQKPNRDQNNQVRNPK